MENDEQIWDGISDETANSTVVTTYAKNEDESGRLKNYENDLRKRRELDEQRAKETQFLR